MLNASHFSTWMARRPAVLAVGLMLLLAAPQPCSAVELDDVIWGFDGTIIEHQFMPVSFLVSNHSTGTVEAEVKLTQQLYVGTERRGAVLQTTVFLSPGESRWIQFVPYIVDRDNNWQVEINNQKFTLPLRQTNAPPAKHAEPVQLIDTNSITGKKGELHRFPDELFPASVTATRTLKVLFLDHVPRWEVGRRRALLEWLYSGGELHLLQGSDDQFPEFPEPLEELNTPLDLFHVGTGTVRRHPMPEKGVTATFLKSLEERRPQKSIRNLDSDASTTDYYESYNYFSKTERIIRQLKTLIHTDHAWWLIYTIAVVYIGINFPGLFMLSRRKLRFQTLYGILLVSIALFSLLYYFIGRRGYGETSQVHTFAVVHPTSESSIMVNGWSNAFVTNGDLYKFDFETPQTLFSTAQTEELVNGIIQDGAFTVDIPPFSSRSFVYQTRLNMAPFNIELSNFKPQGDNLTLDLNIDQRLIGDRKAGHRYFVLYRDRIYDVSPDGQTLHLRANRFRSLETYLKEENIEHDSYNYYYQSERPANMTDEMATRQTMAELMPTVIAQELQINSAADAQNFYIPDDRIRLLAYVKMPDEMFVKEPRLNRQSGYMLYVSDVFLPETP